MIAEEPPVPTWHQQYKRESILEAPSRHKAKAWRYTFKIFLKRENQQKQAVGADKLANPAAPTPLRRSSTVSQRQTISQMITHTVFQNHTTSQTNNTQCLESHNQPCKGVFGSRDLPVAGLPFLEYHTHTKLTPSLPPSPSVRLSEWGQLQHSRAECCPAHINNY